MYIFYQTYLYEKLFVWPHTNRFRERFCFQNATPDVYHDDFYPEGPISVWESAFNAGWDFKSFIVHLSTVNAVKMFVYILNEYMLSLGIKKYFKGLQTVQICENAWGGYVTYEQMMMKR